LSIHNQIEDPLTDSTLPQLCLVVYSPNVYQQLIDDIAAID
jgi:hypothetical protein